LNGGEDYLGERELTQTLERKLKKQVKEQDNQVAYVSGYTYSFNVPSRKVLVFLSDLSQAKIGERSKNGLKNARIHFL
jgi:hypothetical protein